MIRMIQSQSSKQAKSYFDDSLAMSDYYLDGQELPGLFHGKIRERLGLEDEATREAFRLLCDNLHPFTKKPLTPRKKHNRTVYYDINFHAPKSVSILHVLSKDAHVLDAFRASVLETMQTIEKDAKTSVRKKGSNDQRNTNELLWCEFVHQTARPLKNSAPDMHLHSHNVVLNLTWDEIEQRYKAGQFRHIKESMPYYQALFHKYLSDELMVLGYSVRRTKTSFEVVGIPENVLSLFSKRTNEIGQLAKKLNITDAKELDSLGARSRSKKQKGLTLSQLKKDWRRQIIEAGMQDGDGTGETIRHAPDRRLEPTDAQACIDYALEHRFERASVMQDRRILETALRFAIGKEGAAPTGILKTFEADSNILKVKDGNKIVCTTKEALREEKRMIDLAVQGKGQYAPLYIDVPVLSAQGEQADAIRHLLTTTNLVSIIRGGAGTGKTTLMKEAVGLIEKTGKNVLVIAPTAQAARGVLREEGFKNAETVAKLLASSELQDSLKGQVLWVDEAGLLGTKDMAALLKLVSDQGARLILGGDSRQHSSVTKGDAMRVMSKLAGIIPAEVNRIYRQKPSDYRQAVEYLSQGKVTKAFSMLNDMGAIQAVKPSELPSILADDYIASLRAGKTALVVSPTHEQGRAVTNAIRNKMKEVDLLKGHDKIFQRLVNCNLTEAEKRDARHYETGMLLQFNLHQEGIKRGSRWEVTGTKGNVLTLTDGKEVKDFCLEKRKTSFEAYRSIDVNLAIGDQIVMTRNGLDKQDKRLNNGQSMTITGFDKDGCISACNDHSKVPYKLAGDYGHLNHAYCLTSHASQGKTVDAVFIAQPSATFAASDRKQFYVSVSRGSEAVRIYTDDQTSLLDQVSQDGDRLSAIELLKRKKSNEAIDRYLMTVNKPSQSETLAPLTVPHPVTKVRPNEFKPSL